MHSSAATIGKVAGVDGRSFEERRVSLKLGATELQNALELQRQAMLDYEPAQDRNGERWDRARVEFDMSLRAAIDAVKAFAEASDSLLEVCRVERDAIRSALSECYNPSNGKTLAHNVDAVVKALDVANGKLKPQQAGHSKRCGRTDGTCPYYMRDSDVAYCGCPG